MPHTRNKIFSVKNDKPEIKLVIYKQGNHKKEQARGCQNEQKPIIWPQLTFCLVA